MFATQGLSPSLTHCRWILYHLSHQGSPAVVAVIVITPMMTASLGARGYRLLIHIETWRAEGARAFSGVLVP